MVEQSVEQRGHGRRVAEELAPVVDGAIGREDGRGPLIPAHNELEQIFGSSRWQFPHAEVVDDQERDGAERREDLLPRAVERGVGELFEQQMRFAIVHAMALLDRRLAERLRQVTLAATGRTNQQNIFALRDETSGCELEEEPPLPVWCETRPLA